MKKIFLSILLLSGMYLMTSCTDDDYAFKGGVTIYVDKENPTIFDNAIIVDFSSSNAGISGLVIDGLGHSNEDVAMSDASGSVTITAADLGVNFAIDSSTYYDLEATIDGTTATQKGFAVNVVSALSSSGNVMLTAYNAEDTAEVVFGVNTLGGTPTISVSKTVNGAAPIVLDTESNSSSYEFKDGMLIGADYNVGDTIKYMIEAVDGSMSEYATIMLTVADKKLVKFTDAVVSEDNPVFLMKDTIDISVMFDSLSQKFDVTASDIEYLKLSEKLDFDDIVAKFATGATIAAPVLDKTEIGSVWGIKFSYKDSEYYGLLEVGSFSLVEFGASANDVALSYAYDKKE